MGRRPRDEAPGAIHHVVPQGNGRARIVLDDHDRRSYLSRFNRIARERRWTIHASCLLDTHHHGIVETPIPDLGQGMRSIVGGHAAWFNKRHDLAGAVFGDRYWSIRVHDAGHLLLACLYAMLNPVAAGIVDHPSEWPWSSYHSVVADGCSARLAAILGDTPGEARTRFLTLVDAAVDGLAAERRADLAAALRVAREVANVRGARSGRG